MCIVIWHAATCLWAATLWQRLATLVRARCLMLDLCGDCCAGMARRIYNSEVCLACSPVQPCSPLHAVLLAVGVAGQQHVGAADSLDGARVVHRRDVGSAHGCVDVWCAAVGYVAVFVITDTDTGQRSLRGQSCRGRSLRTSRSSQRYRAGASLTVLTTAPRTSTILCLGAGKSVRALDCRQYFSHNL